VLEVGVKSRSEANEFSPDLSNLGTVRVRLTLIDDKGCVGDVDTRASATRVWGPDWRNLMDEVYLACRGQLTK
jgi:hypothetical protein